MTWLDMMSVVRTYIIQAYHTNTSYLLVAVVMSLRVVTY